MNKRIQELIAQASGRTIEDVSEMYWDFEESFAELIVQECAKICGDVGTALFAEEHQSNHGTAATCKTLIEQHFGLK